MRTPKPKQVLILLSVGVLIVLLVHILNAWAAYLTRKQWCDLCYQGSSYHAAGRQRQAVDSLKKAVVLAGKLEDRDKALGLTLNNLGEFYHSQGDYSAAEKTLFRALRLRREAYGQNSYETALTLRNLARVVDDRGEYHLAREMQIKAMGAAKAAEGPDYNRVAMFETDLGGIYIHLGEYTKAEATLRDALKTARRLKDARSEASAMTSLSCVVALQGRFEEAESTARRAIALSDKAFGPTHTDRLLASCNLGCALVDLRRYSEAQKVLEEALRSSLATLGKDHPQTAMLEMSLSTALMYTHKCAAAEHLCRQALGTNERALGPLHSATIRARYSLIEILAEQRKCPEAQALFKQQIMEAEKAHGPISSILAGTLEDYAWFLRKINRSSDADQAAARAKKIRIERHRRNLPDPKAPPAFPVA